MRGEPGTEGHRYLGSSQRTFQGTLEVTMAGEPEPSTLGISQTQALDRRDMVSGAWWDASAHRLTEESLSCASSVITASSPVD